VKPAKVLTLEKARACWLAHQRLGLSSDIEDIPGGWIRTLGGAAPYLALHARNPNAKKTSMDEALLRERVWITPGVRGCIWLTSADDLPLALRLALAHNSHK